MYVCERICLHLPFFAIIHVYAFLCTNIPRHLCIYICMYALYICVQAEKAQKAKKSGVGENTNVYVYTMQMTKYVCVYIYVCVDLRTVYFGRDNSHKIYNI